MEKQKFSLIGFLKRDTVAAVVCMMPFIIGFLAFLLVPMIQSLYFSFTNFHMIRPTYEFVGFENFQRMFNDTRFWSSLRATFNFVFGSVPLRLLFALIVALLLLKGSKMSGIYRAMYYLPSILGGSLAVVILWGRIFASDGLLNQILDLVGLNQHFPWLGDASTTIWTLILLAVWQFGSSMLIFLSALKQIPDQLYEASAIDGSGKIGSFFKITLPLLTPTIFFNLVMQTIAGFLAFTQAFVITQGGPRDTTRFYVLHMYETIFNFNRAGEGAAQAWIMLIIIGVITLILFKTKRFWVYDGGY
ncbi:MAG: sugar ABC transporter permease [Oscillospiraceae bacterium]|nr:sugar ABC transporter permease [Oscillospiraceae bacterium]